MSGTATSLFEDGGERGLGTALSMDASATLLWSSEESFGAELPELRRDFERLDDALSFLADQVALGRRHTAWLIAGNRLIPPEHVRELTGRLAA